MSLLLTDDEITSLRLLLALLPPADPAVNQSDVLLLPDVPDLERVPTDDDAVLVRTQPAGEAAMTPLASLRSLLAPGDLFSSTAAPTAQVPGLPTQRYWHVRTPTRADLWEFENGGWVLKIQGFVLDPASDALPTPPAGTFINFNDTQAGGSVQFVPPTGVPITEFLWKFTVKEPYQTMPLDGLITVPNAAGAVYAYAPATATHAQVPLATSNNFTAYVDPTPGTTTPPAPTFTNFQDTRAGGSVTLVPASGVPMSLYLYKVGASGTYAAAPLDGIINVGNIDGQVFAYSRASGTLNQSLTGASPNFTRADEPGNTTPEPPTFSNFDDAANTVLIVPATGVSMALVVFALPGSSTFNAAPSDGLVSVGNVAGVVQAKSLAGGSLNPSAVRSSQTFTVAQAPAPVITFAALPAKENTDGPFQLSASSTNTVTPLTFTSGNASVLTISGTTATIVGVGTASVTVSQAAGNGYSAGSFTQQQQVTAHVYNGSYTTTNQDYFDKCQMDGASQPITRTATSTDSQAAADLAAKNAAITAIVCPAPLPSYNTTLNKNNQITDGMSFSPAGNEVLKFNVIINTSGPTISIAITALGATSYVDYASEYAGAGYAFFDANGVRHDGTFPSSDNLNIQY